MTDKKAPILTLETTNIDETPPKSASGRYDMNDRAPAPNTDEALLAAASLTRGISLGAPDRWDRLVREYSTRFTGRPRGRPKKDAADLSKPDPIAATYRKAGVDPSSKDAARTCALHFARKEEARLFPARLPRRVGRQRDIEYFRMVTVLMSAGVEPTDSARAAARKIEKNRERFVDGVTDGYENTDEDTLVELIKRHRRLMKNKSDPN